MTTAWAKGGVLEEARPGTGPEDSEALHGDWRVFKEKEGKDAEEGGARKGRPPVSLGTRMTGTGRNMAYGIMGRSRGQDPGFSYGLPLAHCTLENTLTQTS